MGKIVHFSFSLHAVLFDLIIIRHFFLYSKVAYIPHHLDSLGQYLPRSFLAVCVCVCVRQHTGAKRTKKFYN